MAALAVATLTGTKRTVVERRLGIVEPDALRNEMRAWEREICGCEAVHAEVRRAEQGAECRMRGHFRSWGSGE